MGSSSSGALSREGASTRGPVVGWWHSGRKEHPLASLNFDSTGAHWESRRAKFQAYADVSGMGAHLDVAAEQAATTKNEGLDAGAVLVSGAVHVLLITKCEGEALSLVSLVSRRHGLEASRVLNGEYKGKVGNRMAAFLRGILNPRARWEQSGT